MQLIEPQKQPTSSTCGQTVVSMVVDRPIEKIYNLIGKGKASSWNMRNAFRTCNWNMARLSCCRLPKLPSCGLAVFFGQTIIHHRMFGHWMLWVGDAFFDPTTGTRRVDLGEDSWSGRFYELSRDPGSS